MFTSKLRELGLDVNPREGNQKVKCPKCGDDPKHKGRKDVSVHTRKGAYMCKSASCDFKGFVGGRPEYKRPKWEENKTELSMYGLAFLKGRGIDQKTINDLKLTTNGGNLIFNYFRDGELINWKSRGLKKKEFRQFVEAEKILYNLDSLKGKRKAIIVEGEIDVLTLNMIPWVRNNFGIVSLDQGCGQRGSKFDGKLECLENCALEIDGIEEWILLLDKDDPGQYFEEELIRRFGEYRCLTVDISKKDVNEVLLAGLELGQESHIALESIKIAIDKAVPVPVPGILRLDPEMEARMLGYYANGWPRGTSTYFHELDKCFTFLPGDITLVTGIPNDGKGTFIRQLAVIKAVKDGFKWACYVPEDFPAEIFYEDLCHAFIGKPLDEEFCKRYKRDRATIEEFKLAMAFIKDHFYCIYPMANRETGDIALPSNEWINKRIRFLKLKYGVNAYIKDPWNKIYHDFQGREDQYLGKEISKEKFFASEFDAAIYVAHPAKMKKDADGRFPVPGAYDLSGGAMFNNMFDNIIAVFRPNRAKDPTDKMVEVHVHKIKKQKQVGRPGVWTGTFDFESNRYFQISDNTNPLVNASDEVLDFDKDLPF